MFAALHQHCQGVLTELQALPPRQTCEWRALFKSRAAAKRKSTAIPSLDRHRSAALRYPFYVGSRPLTLRPRSVAMGRGSASSCSGAHLSSIHFLHFRTRRSVFVMLYRNGIKKQHDNLNDRPPPALPGLFFCRRTQPPEARARSDSDGLSQPASIAPR